MKTVPTSRARRGRVVLTAAAAALALTLSACGSDSAASGDEAETRTVTDALGTEVKVPKEPKRVATLHYAATQPVLDLGITPVGQGSFEEGIIPEDLVETVADVPVVTNDATEPQLEKITGVDPDLILAPNVLEEEVLKQLEAIAPVYVFTLRGGDRANWAQRTEEIADALNATERVDELASDFAKRQEEIATTYADVIEGRTVGVIGAYEENNFYAWGEKNMSGTLLEPLGFTWSAREDAVVSKEKEPEATVSFEKIGSTVGDADILFLDSNLREEVNPFMEALQGTKLYQQLPAVKADQAYVMGKNTVAGYTDAHYSLDRVEDALQDLQAK
ncbi:ABC transporter substrate-binding protein [Aeromicrobium choanae]|uniref:Iron complex transport system substrate-binding protein n=1 Tax=Aeromicrobium choanae TaxID=1736691 RepID=A0A1T4Z7B3_9ACTN|nr:ABC transporter substrate-binding protein [Aeromicrobium choanae]SKB09465.1 iron complex transport system substrate-binding protein [Aeromicrobium choanae]